MPLGLLPLPVGCATAYLASSLLMPNTIMTERLVRRGVSVPTDYAAEVPGEPMNGCAV
ncbi:MAG: hypothetical protein ABSH22_14825 [Tepidisphaeraceae bacterium]|jgi:hypothetical protein